MLQDKLKNRVRSRITPDILQLFQDNHITKVIIAGGALLRHARDLDFYPHPDQVEKFQTMTLPTSAILARTVNSTTLRIGDDVVQLCRYHKATLRILVQSFDFAHCQVGASVFLSKNGIGKIDPYWTPNFLQAMSSQSTFYTGSDYPLSSLVRITRISQKLQLSRGEQVGLVLKVLNDVVQRGFNGYDDFKDQLDAVDLGLVPEELDHIDFEELKILFRLLDKTEDIFGG